MRTSWAWIKTDQKGQGLTEYLILLLLISVVSIAAVRTLGTTIREKLEEVRRHINSEVTLSDERK